MTQDDASTSRAVRRRMDERSTRCGIMRRMRLLPVLCALCACAPHIEPGVTVLATSEVAPLAAASLQFLPADALRHEVVADPSTELTRRGGFVIALVKRDDCTQCYRLEGDAQRIT